MKKTLLVLMLILTLLLSSCTSRPDATDAIIQQQSTVAMQAFNDLTQAFQRRDATALKALFSPDVRQGYDLDTPIEQLLAYTGSKELHTEPGTNPSVSTDQIAEHLTVRASFSFTLYVDNEPHTIHVTVTSHCDADPDRVGITELVVWSDYALCRVGYLNDYTGITRSPWQQEGMQLHLQHGDDFQIRRISGTPCIWTPHERTILLSEFLAVLEATPTLPSIEAAFGPPNVQAGITRTYEVIDENDQIRYVFITLNDDGRLSNVSLHNDKTALQTLWYAGQLP